MRYPIARATGIVATIALWLAGVWLPGAQQLATAQDPAAPPDLASQLADFLQAQGAAAVAKRNDLARHGADEILRGIAAMRFGKPSATGAIRYDIPCPDGHARPAWVTLPESYDPTRRYALLVQLHGGVSGVPADRVEGTAERWPSLFDADTQDVIVACPAADCPRTGQEARWWRNGGQQNVMALIRYLRCTYNINDDRIFLTGHSDGGSGTFAMAARRPDNFAGFLPMCGEPRVPPSDGVTVWLQNFGDSHIYAINGGRDQLYPGEQVRTAIDTSNANGARIEFKLYPEAGHDLSYLEAEAPGILRDRIGKWRRNLLPERMDWSSDDIERGRRAWLSIDGIQKLADSWNAVDEAATFDMGPRRVLLGVNVDRDVAPGVGIGGVQDDSPAAQAGIQVGDVIVEMNGTAIANLDQLRAVLAACSPGDAFRVKVTRAGTTHELTGTFPGTDSADPVVVARLTATREPGTVNVQARNASSLSVWVAPSMVAADGTLRITVNGKPAFSGTVKPDAGVILDEFHATADRTRPFVARITINVIDLLTPRTLREEDF